MPPGMTCSAPHRLHVEKAVSLRSDGLAVRAAILAAVAAAVPGAWHTLDVAVRARSKPSRRIFCAPTSTPIICVTQRPANICAALPRGIAWKARCFSHVLTGPLFWLGLIDVDSGATAFCADAARRASCWVLTHEAAEAAEVDRVFTVRADATIHISPARRYDRFQVARVADLIAVVNDEYRYRLTPSSLTRANSQKISTEKVLDYSGAGCRSGSAADVDQSDSTLGQQRHRSESRTRGDRAGERCGDLEALAGIAPDARLSDRAIGADGRAHQRERLAEVGCDSGRGGSISGLVQ